MKNRRRRKAKAWRAFRRRFQDFMASRGVSFKRVPLIAGPDGGSANFNRLQTEQPATWDGKSTTGGRAAKAICEENA